MTGRIDHAQAENPQRDEEAVQGLGQWQGPAQALWVVAPDEPQERQAGPPAAQANDAQRRGRNPTGPLGPASSPWRQPARCGSRQAGGSGRKGPDLDRHSGHRRSGAEVRLTVYRPPPTDELARTRARVSFDGVAFVNHPEIPHGPGASRRTPMFEMRPERCVPRAVRPETSRRRGSSRPPRDLSEAAVASSNRPRKP